MYLLGKLIGWSFASLFSDATGLDTLWIGVDKPKSKLDPVYLD